MVNLTIALRMVLSSLDPQKDAYEGFSSWSPNGNQFAYYHQQRNNLRDPYTQVDINLLDISHGTVRKLTDKPGEYGNLRWSPDGKQIAFTKGDYTHQNLYVTSNDVTNFHTGLTKLLNQRLGKNLITLLLDRPISQLEVF